MSEMNIHTPTKSTAICVTIACLFAVAMAIVLFVVGIQKNELWCCPVAIIAAIAMFKYAKDIWDEYNNYNYVNQWLQKLL